VDFGVISDKSYFTMKDHVLAVMIVADKFDLLPNMYVIHLFDPTRPYFSTDEIGGGGL
jgi:hypothetical protein